jgi:hypothetical protein
MAGNYSVTVNPTTTPGSSVIALDATDSTGATIRSTFVVTVNAAPTISSVSATGSTEQKPRVIPVTVAQGTPPLIITGSSSNISIIPDSYFTITRGDGFNQLVTIDTARNKLGTVRVTLTVTDAKGVTASTQFDFTVSANPRLTTAIIAPATEGGKASTEILIPITGGTPPYTATATSSNTAVIPSSGITFTAKPDGTYVIVVTSLAGQSGNVTITLNIKDSANASFSTSFVYTVSAGATSDDGFFTTENIIFYIAIPAGGLIVLVAAICLIPRCIKCECTLCKRAGKRLSGFGGAGLRGSLTKPAGTELSSLSMDAPSPRGDSGPISMPAAAL